jgi:mannose-6-phosphate isomerase-like protein (cupin superfamily)
MSPDDPMTWPAGEPAAELAADPATPRMRCRWVGPPPRGAWSAAVVSEWELRAAGWQDRHPHTETNYVLAGELFVESGGELVVLRAGDSVIVDAGTTGRYWAPVYALMLAVYGPNPAGAVTSDERYWEIDQPAG